MTILYTLLVIIAAVLATTSTSLYDLTIYLFNQLAWGCYTNELSCYVTPHPQQASKLKDTGFINC